MGVTGSGCEHCNGGLVNWNDEPYERERDGIDYKPCDRCGGWSQFAKPDEVAARHATADAIVTALAERFETYKSHGDGFPCLFCDGIMGDHRPSCIGISARAYVASQHAPGQKEK
jgi:hypothetical protein